MSCVMLDHPLRKHYLRVVRNIARLDRLAGQITSALFQSLIVRITDEEIRRLKCMHDRVAYLIWVYDQEEKCCEREMAGL